MLDPVACFMEFKRVICITEAYKMINFGLEKHRTQKGIRRTQIGKFCCFTVLLNEQMQLCAS